jgi:hypothetical protein
VLLALLVLLAFAAISFSAAISDAVSDAVTLTEEFEVFVSFSAAISASSSDAPTDEAFGMFAGWRL